MQHLFFLLNMILLSKGHFSFSSDIWIVFIVIPVAAYAAYKSPWTSPMVAALSIATLVTVIILLGFLHIGVAIFSGIAAGLGIAAKIVFKK